MTHAAAESKLRVLAVMLVNGRDDMVRPERPF
jgi:hypothetical protein